MRLQISSTSEPLAKTERLFLFVRILDSALVCLYDGATANVSYLNTTRHPPGLPLARPDKLLSQMLFFYSPS